MNTDHSLILMTLCTFINNKTNTKKIKNKQSKQTDKKNPASPSENELESYCTIVFND